MNLNLYDAEQHLLRQKELARAAAESYAHTRHLPRRGLRHAYQRALVATGDRMIRLGYRLRGEPVLSGPWAVVSDPWLTPDQMTY